MSLHKPSYTDRKKEKMKAMWLLRMCLERLTPDRHKGVQLCLAVGEIAGLMASVRVCDQMSFCVLSEEPDR